MNFASAARSFLGGGSGVFDPSMSKSKNIRASSVPICMCLSKDEYRGMIASRWAKANKSPKLQDAFGSPGEIKRLLYDLEFGIPAIHQTVNGSIITCSVCPPKS